MASNIFQPLLDTSTYFRGIYQKTHRMEFPVQIWSTRSCWQTGLPWIWIWDMLNLDYWDGCLLLDFRPRLLVTAFATRFLQRQLQFYVWGPLLSNDRHRVGCLLGKSWSGNHEFDHSWLGFPACHCMFSDQPSSGNEMEKLCWAHPKCPETILYYYSISLTPTVPKWTIRTPRHSLSTNQILYIQNKKHRQTINIQAQSRQLL